MKICLFALLLVCAPLLAQTQPTETPQQTKPASSHDSMPDMPGMDMHDMNMPMHDDAVQQFLHGQSSGTSSNPESAPMPMRMTMEHDWMLMLHGQAFVNQVVETGPRGGDRLYSSNWIMGMAERPLAGGQLMLRSMLSLEPLTIANERYPELFQTGETAHGRPIVDGQHPHDLFMELAAEFAIGLGHGTIGYVYAAPMGDPALGPIAYPHRASAMELPQSTLGHHLEDSTHIAASVLTLGAKRGPFGLAVSGFRGAEPDENRWNLEHGAIDSWSIRGTWDPTPDLTAQISTGHLEHPEALEPGNVQRTTASVIHHHAFGADSEVSTSLIWGHNHKDDGGTNGFTAEGLYRFRSSNYLTARLEIVDKDELFADSDLPFDTSALSPHATYRITALTLGYTKDVLRTRDLLVGIGGNVSAYSFDSALDTAYGRRPRSYYAFIRIRSAG